MLRVSRMSGERDYVREVEPPLNAKINFAFFNIRVDVRKITAYNALKEKIMFIVKKIKFSNDLKRSSAHSRDFRVE